jgi:gas vesicle protein
MDNTKTTKTQNRDKKNNTSENGSPIKRSIKGAVIGAAVGYLATPENGRKLMQKISTDKVKKAGSSITHAVKEKSKNAAASIKKSSGKLFDKNKDISINGYFNEKDQASQNETSIESAIGKSNDKKNEKPSNNENENLNGRLDRLEKMLAQLAE